MPAPNTGARNPSVPAIFLDKDGTLIENLPYNVDVTRIRFYPEALPVIAQLSAAGYRLIVVSNQPGIAHGYFGVDAIDAVRNAISDAFEACGVSLSGFYFCPHHPEGRVREYASFCNCRKPAAGLIERAAKEHHIDTRRSWMIGDILNDIEAGNRAGCRTILVDRGNETEWMAGRFRRPDWVVCDLSGVLRHVPRVEDGATHANEMTMSVNS